MTESEMLFIGDFTSTLGVDREECLVTNVEVSVVVVVLGVERELVVEMKSVLGITRRSKTFL